MTFSASRLTAEAFEFRTSASAAISPADRARSFRFETMLPEIAGM
jgi:hypothetical protein